MAPVCGLCGNEDDRDLCNCNELLESSSIEMIDIYRIFRSL